MKEKSLFQRAILCATVFVLLLIAASAFSQTHTVQTRNDSGAITITFESAGVDALRITASGKSGIVKVRHLDKAGSLTDRVASLCATAEDGAMPLRSFLRIQTCAGCNVDRSARKLTQYHRKAQKVYRDLCAIINPATLLEMTYMVLQE